MSHPESIKCSTDSCREIGGEVRKVAILTYKLDPYASYLARQLRPLGCQIMIINQTDRKIRPASFKHYMLLRKSRGLWIALDYFLLNLVRNTAIRLRNAFQWVGDRLTGRESQEKLQVANWQQPWASSSYPDAVRKAVGGIAEEDWLTITEVTNINQPPDQDRITAWAPDLLLLAGAPIISRKTISIAKVACLNAHCGITPDYCGSSPVDWALYEKRFDDIGYTVHVVVPAVDAGPIIHQQRVAWDPHQMSARSMPKIVMAMYGKLIETVERLVRGERIPVMPPGKPRAMPPAGLFVRLLAERRRRQYAKRLRCQDKVSDERS